MTGFKDDKDRVWGPRVTTRTLLRLRQETGVSMFKRLATAAAGVDEDVPGEKLDEVRKAAAAAAFADLFQDEMIMYTLLYLSVENQAKERTVSQDELLDSLSSSALMMVAVSCVQEAVSDFFRAAVEQEEAAEAQ